MKCVLTNLIVLCFLLTFVKGKNLLQPSSVGLQPPVHRGGRASMEIDLDVGDNVKRSDRPGGDYNENYEYYENYEYPNYHQNEKLSAGKKVRICILNSQGEYCMKDK